MYNVDLYLHFQSNLSQSKSSKLGPRGPPKRNPLKCSGSLLLVVRVKDYNPYPFH